MSANEPPALAAIKHPPSVVLFIGVVLCVLAADLITKSLAFQHVAAEPVVLTRENVHLSATIPPHEEITLVPRILALKLMVNLGAVFGIGQGQRSAFIVISLVAVAVIGYIFTRSAARDWPNHLAWGLILAGALGNLYDRFFFGGVRDMFWLFPHVDLPFGWRWPEGLAQLPPWVANTGPRGLYPWIFNIADVALLTGVGLVIAVSWKRERQRLRRQIAANAQG